jgi:3-oxoadipate CoA-transferase alpha subunit
MRTASLITGLLSLVPFDTGEKKVISFTINKPAVSCFPRDEMTVNKVFKSCDEAVADVFSGATVMVGGFGSFGGLPVNLIVALAGQGAKDLTVIANMGGVGFELTKRIKPGGYQDLGSIFEKGMVKKFIGSVPALGGMPPDSPIEKLYREGKVEIETVPQGTLAERIRCGAGGLGGFYTPVGVGTVVEKGKEKKVIRGKEYILELPLTADFALIKAHKADTLGNLVYRKTARCFNPVMAMAAKVTIIEVDRVVPVGALDPEVIVTPHVYVTRIVEAPQ